MIDSLGIGGAEQVIRQPLKYLDCYRHYIVVLNEPIDRNNIPDTISIFNLNYTGIHSIPRVIWKLRKIIKKTRPNIIHSHLVVSTLVARLANLSYSRLISTYHSLLYNPQNRQYDKKLKLADKFTTSLSDFNIYVSEQVKNMYDATVSKKVAGKVVYNFYNSSFSPSNNSCQIRFPVKLICVANYRPEKNHDVIVEAFQHLKKDYFLTLVGNGFDKSRYTDIPGINIVHSNEVQSFLLENDIFISASSFEGFGIAVLEAMATGLPCILSDIPTYREIFGDNCLYFNNKDPLQLANLIEELSQQEELLQQLSEKSIKTALNYTIERYVKEISQCYEMF